MSPKASAMERCVNAVTLPMVPMAAVTVRNSHI